MGDAGSYMLGFSLAYFGVSASVEAGGPVPFAVVLLFWGAFLADTSLTLAWRGLRGENVLHSHRSHHYQKLTDLGFSHSSVAALYFALTLALGAAGLAYARGSGGLQSALLLGAGAVLGLSALAIRRAGARV